MGSEKDVREELYDVVEAFYGLITSNQEINLKEEITLFIDSLKDIRKEL